MFAMQLAPDLPPRQDYNDDDDDDDEDNDNNDDDSDSDKDGVYDGGGDESHEII